MYVGFIGITLVLVAYASMTASCVMLYKAANDQKKRIRQLENMLAIANEHLSEFAGNGAKLLFEQALVVSVSCSHCGNCGYGGHAEFAFTEDDPHRCISCGTRFKFTFMTYDLFPIANEAFDREKIEMLSKSFPGLRPLGVGNGSLDCDSLPASVSRLFDPRMVDEILEITAS